MARPSWTRSWKAALVASVLGLSISLGLLAVAENSARQDELGKMILVFDPPGRKYALPPTEEFKDRGWREGLIPPDKPPGMTRILCVGDSLTYGVQVSPKEAWPDLLHQWLRAQTGKAAIEVRNMALNGWDAQQVASLAGPELEAWEPDLVIWGTYGNDLEPTRVLYGTDSGNPVYVGSDVPEEIRLLPESVALNLRSHSALYRGWLGTRYVRWIAEQPRQGRDDPAFYAHHLLTLQSWTESQDIPLLVAAIPAHVLADPSACPDSYGGDPEPCRVAQSRHEQIVSQLEAAQVDYVDLLSAFQDSGSPHFHPEGRPDPDHPNPAGHRLIARSLLPWIQSELRLEILLPEAAGG